MQLIKYDLPRDMGHPGEPNAIVVGVFRYFLATEDGKLYTQDETLYTKVDASVNGGRPTPLPSHRTAWEQLPSPPVQPHYVGVTTWNDQPCALRSDGRAFIWGFAAEEAQGTQDRLPHWHPVFEAAP